MHQTTITFPDLHRSPRDGHKLRGYFSQLFGAESDLWHNHRADGKPIYRYPLIQYKVVQQQPMLTGLGEGAQLLTQHFLDVKELHIDGLRIPLRSKQIKSHKVDIGVNGQLYTYRFANPWFALNQANFQRYKKAAPDEQQQLLQRLLTGHILAFYKGIGHWEKHNIATTFTELQPLTAQFKNQPMLMFKGQFVTNARLPEYIGLGKSVARGFGTICKPDLPSLPS